MLSDVMKKLTKEQKDIIESRRHDIDGIMKVLTVMYTPFIAGEDYYSYSPKKLTPIHIGDHNVHIYHELHIEPFGSFIHDDGFPFIQFALLVHCDFRDEKLKLRQQITVSFDDVFWNNFLQYFTKMMNEQLNQMLNSIYAKVTDQFFKGQEDLGIEDKYFNIVKENWIIPEWMDTQFM